MTLHSIGKAMLAVIVIASLGTAFGCGGSSSKQKVVIKGSTTVLPITLKAIESYKKVKKDVSVTVEGSGSGNGIKALLDGACDIANSSREIKKDETEMAQKSGIKVKEIAIAYDMIVPIVHPKNPITKITKDQLKGIYEGNITNWKQLGGADETIIVVSRDTSSGTYEYWHEDVLKKADVKKEALTQASSGAVVTTIAGNPKAIGYVGFGYIKKDANIKGLLVNDVEPTLENGKSGKYPISRKLYMYVNDAKISGQTKGFVDYLLGDDGQKLVSEAGFIPMK
jgi:phosphate transport system substrate-binding protein